MLPSRTIQIGSQSIAVYESEGSGPAALLIHGNSLSARSFQHQLQGPLGKAFRLVAIDLPGHGNSADAQDPAAAYNLPGYASIVAAAAEQLGLLDAAIVGWSLGGHIALEAAQLLPAARSFLIFGTPPLGIPPAMADAFLPSPAMGAAFTEHMTEEDVQAFVTGLFPTGTDIPEFFFEDVRRTDGRARAQLAISVGTVNYTDELQIVNSLSRPLAIIHGEQEQFVNLSYIQGLTIPTLWRGAVQLIKQAGHATQWTPSSKFNSLLASFLIETAQ
jgi:pimeloyl-ACP methyl ester carboxylesterase